MRAHLDAYFDGVATDEQVEALVDWLKADPRHAERFMLHSITHAGLRLHVGAGEGVDVAGGVPRTPVRARVPHRPRPMISGRALTAASLIAAAVAIAIYLFAINPTSRTRDLYPVGPPIATLIDATRIVLINEDLGASGSDYPAGTYSLEAGEAEFLLTNRVTVNLRGQTRLVMRSPMSASLETGTARFDCPPGAEGFTVHLPGGARVVDLGTRFVLNRNAQTGIAVARVIEGLVRVDFEGSARESEFVRKGESLVLGADGLGLARPLDEAVLLNDPLNGSPEVALDGVRSGSADSGAIWAASGWRADGSIGPGESANAFLPFTPTAGRIYTLSCELDPVTARIRSNWFAFGYTGQAAPRGAFHEVSAPAALALVRAQRGPGGIQLMSSKRDYQDLDAPMGPVRLAIVLDTTAEPWTATWLVDGEPVRGPIALPDAHTIRYVGFGRREDAQGTIRNFRLSAVHVENGLKPIPGDSQ